MVRMGRPGAREGALNLHQAARSRCDTTRRAPVRTMASILVRAMAPDSSANFTENVPPKPQHSSAGSSRGARGPRRARAAGAAPLLIPSSRSAWQPSWNVTTSFMRAPTSSTPATSVRNVENSQTFAPFDARRTRRAFAAPSGTARRSGGATIDGAGAGGHHDVLAHLESVEEVARHLPGLVAIAAVEGGLAAAGLVLGKVDRSRARSSTSAIAIPTLGKSWSTMQVTNSATSWHGSHILS